MVGLLDVIKFCVILYCQVLLGKCANARMEIAGEFLLQDVLLQCTDCVAKPTKGSVR